jgi:hypothetical protein
VLPMLLHEFNWKEEVLQAGEPGDIRIERDNLRVYFPLTTCLLLSLVLTLVLWLIRLWRH